MVNLLKKKHKLCKKYREDIWGEVLRTGKFTRLGEFLSTQREEGRRSRTDFFKKLLEDRKKVCLFYGGLKVYEYKRYCKEARRISKGNFSDCVVSLLERRLDVCLYRMHFVRSVADGANLVRSGKVWVNRVQVTAPYHLLRVGDVIELSSEAALRLEQTFLPQMCPKYLEPNYKAMAGVLLHTPKMAEVYYPFTLDEDFFYLSHFSRFA